MGLDPQEHELVYRLGWLAGMSDLPLTENPHMGHVDREAVWDLGWHRGSSGQDYDGRA